MTLKEAAAVVADLYEAIPDTYLRGMYLGMNGDTPCFCAIGGVSLCLRGGGNTSTRVRAINFLKPYARKLGYTAVDHSRETAETKRILGEPT